MAKSATESRTGSDSAPEWLKGIDKWRSTAGRFLSDTLGELGDVIEAIESCVEASAAPSTAPTAPSETVVALPAAPTRIERAPVPEPPELRSKEPTDAIRAPLVPPTEMTKPTPAAAPGSCDERLAELARRLGEKLERSGAQGTANAP